MLIFGRFLALGGSLVFMMLTLILKNKLNYSSSQIADVLMIIAVTMIPTLYFSGKLADRYDKLKLIIMFNLGSVLCNLICSVIPVSTWTIVFYVISSLLTQMDGPCYDALFAELSKTADRDRLYSLSYLAINAGAVLPPIIGGFLFEKHLNLSFLITALSLLVATILIMVFVKDDKKIVELGEGIIASYQKAEAPDLSIIKVLNQRKVLWLFISCTIGAGLVYSQLSYLLPLNLESLFFGQGAFYFGLLMSCNALIVIFTTPFLTKLCRFWTDPKKILTGEILIVGALACYIFVQGYLPLYFISMGIFTFGEVLITLGSGPYLSKRIPASHRGRIVSLVGIACQVSEPLFKKLMGFIVDKYSYSTAWQVVILVGSSVIVLLIILRQRDTKAFPYLTKADN